ncbi:MAG TPA: alpha-glucan family phosphorylase [Acidimicrobiales bacterium]|nr:alpha-glucan family phosphorylase [Acidimicrobiales bacterium]
MTLSSEVAPRRGGVDGPNPLVAYFSMEVALSDEIPTYSGGLGVLAGDFLRAAADLGLPLVGVTLCYGGGYFRQQLDKQGRQGEAPVSWDPCSLLEAIPDTVQVEVAGRPVTVGAFRYVITGLGGHEVPVYLLDTDLEGNDDEARAITGRLYGGGEHYRLEQETVLGIGGVDLLAALGLDELRTFHMNEGHSSLLTLRLLERELAGSGAGDEPGAAQIEAVRRRCAFTTHTPVPAGHDRFGATLVAEVVGEPRTKVLDRIGQLGSGLLNMTDLGMGLSGYVNAVSVKHGEVTRAMFPDVEVASITNGVHAVTWVAPSTERLLDEHVPNWRAHNGLLRQAMGIPLAELRDAHDVAKRALLAVVSRRCGRKLDPNAFTIGLARRAAAYKQTALIFTDLDRLEHVARDIGPLQVVCAAKAHPRDEAGKALIVTIFDAAKRLKGKVEVVFLADYDLATARLMCAGTDVWLNNPQKPYEASGTSGMKAALNGVPSLSTLDGWWIEGCMHGVTGWAIGGMADGDDAADLYEMLEGTVMPLYYEDEDGWTAVMRNAIALNGSFFNTERMAAEYANEAYHLVPSAWRSAPPAP